MDKHVLNRQTRRMLERMVMISLMIFFLLTMFLIINKEGFRLILYSVLAACTSFRVCDGLMGRRQRDDF